MEEDDLAESATNLEQNLKTVSVLRQLLHKIKQLLTGMRLNNAIETVVKMTRAKYPLELVEKSSEEIAQMTPEDKRVISTL